MGRGKSLKSMARIILEASLEVRGAIVYATLIEVFAIMPVFFMEGLSGAFFKPLAMAYALALLVSMVVALTVTPALSLIMLRNAPLESRESPIVRWLQAAYAKILAPIIRTPRIAYAMVGVIVLAGAVVVFPRPPTANEVSQLVPNGGRDWATELLPVVQRTRLPHALAHRPEHVVAGNGPHHDSGQQGAAARSPASATSAPTSARPSSWTKWLACISAKTGSASIRSVDYDETLNKIQEAVDGYPGLYRDVQTYLKERIREVLTGSSRGHHGAHLWPRPRRAARQGRRSAQSHGRRRRPRRFEGASAAEESRRSTSR